MMKPQLTHKSELMEQIVSQRALPPTEKFFVAKCADADHMIFSKGTDGKFYLALLGHKSGTNRLIDFGERFKITSKIIALNVSQDLDRTIHLVFATEGAADQGSKIYVVEPLKETEANWVDCEDLSGRVLIAPAKSGLIVREIYLGSADDGLGYPLLAFVYSQANHNLPPNADLARVSVDLGAKSWSYLPNYSLSQNAAEMIDICPASLSAGRGFFALYRIQGKKALRFVAFPDTLYNQKIVTELKVPEGAAALSSSLNPNGFTDLFVGGRGLYHFNSKACQASGSAGVLVSGATLNNDTHGVFSAVRQLQIVQDQNVLSVWARNESGDVGYQQFSTKLSSITSPTPLIPQSQGGGMFACSLDVKNGNQQVFVVGGDGCLRVLDQRGVPKTWQPAVEVAYPSLTETLSFTSYTTHICLEDAGGVPMSFENIRLSTPYLKPFFINGKSVNVDREGVVVPTDTSGNITVISQSPDFICCTLTAAVISTGEVAVIDPAAQVAERLQAIASSPDPGSHKLFKSANLTPHESAKAVATVKQFAACLGAKVEEPKSDTTRFDSAPAAESGALNAAQPAQLNVAGDGVWHWITNQLGRLKDAVVECFEGVWRVVVTWADKFWTFVLNTSSAVCSAVKWFFVDVIGCAISSVIDALGFLFAWDDICDTKDLLVEAINSGMDWLADGVDIFSTGVDDFFDDLKKTINDFTLPDHLKNQTMDSADAVASADQKTVAEQKNAMDGPGGNWSNYQLQHGGIMSSRTDPAHPSSDSTDFLAPLQTMISELGDQFINTFETLVSRFKEMFDPKSKLSIGDIFKIIGGDIAKAFVEGTQTVVRALLKSFAAILRFFKKGMNAKIELPLLSSLYKTISGKDLTALDAICLLLAVPTTVMMKLTLRKRPRDLEGAESALAALRSGSKGTPSISEQNDKVPGQESSMTRASTVLIPIEFTCIEATHIRVEPLKEIPVLFPSEEAASNDQSSEDSQNVKSDWFDTLPSTTPIDDARKNDSPAGAGVNLTRADFNTQLKTWISKPPRDGWVWLADIVSLGAIAGNYISNIVFFTTTLYGPEAPTFNGFFYASVALDLAIFVGTFPFWRNHKQPVKSAILRGISWGIGIVNILFRWCHKRGRAVIGLIVGSVQSILDIIVLCWDIGSTREEYYMRPEEGASMILHGATVVAGSVAKVAGSIVVHVNGAEPVSLAATGLAKWVTPTLDLTAFLVQCGSDDPRHVHVFSLLSV